MPVSVLRQLEGYGVMFLANKVIYQFWEMGKDFKNGGKHLYIVVSSTKTIIMVGKSNERN